MRLFSWLKQSFGAYLKSLGERTLARMIFRPMHGMPGAWSSNHIEQAYHFRHWVYIASRARAQKLGQLKPNCSVIRDVPQGQRAKWLTGPARRKALAAVRSSEDLEPLAHDHRLCQLFDNPNEPDTAYDLWYETSMFLDLTGNAYWWLVKDRLGLPAEIWVLPSHWVFPIMGKERLIDAYEVRPFEGGVYVPQRFDADDIVHFKFKSPVSKIDGHSPLQAGAEAVDTFESVQSARWSSFKQGAWPGLALEIGADSPIDDPSDEDIQRIQAKFLAKFQGEFNYHRPAVLPKGVKLTPLTIAPHEMDFVQSADQLRDMILALFQVPKTVCGITESVNYASMVSSMAQFCSFAINPLTTQLGQQVTEKLARRFFGPHVRVWWEDCTPDDPQHVLAQNQACLAGGVIVINEWRQELGLAPYANGGDDPILPMGMAPMPLATGDKLDLTAITNAVAEMQAAQQPKPPEQPEQPGAAEKPAIGGTPGASSNGNGNGTDGGLGEMLNLGLRNGKRKGDAKEQHIKTPTGRRRLLSALNVQKNGKHNKPDPAVESAKALAAVGGITGALQVSQQVRSGLVDPEAAIHVLSQAGMAPSDAEKLIGSPKEPLDSSPKEDWQPIVKLMGDALVSAQKIEQDLKAEVETLRNEKSAAEAATIEARLLAEAQRESANASLAKAIDKIMHVLTQPPQPQPAPIVNVTVPKPGKIVTETTRVVRDKDNRIVKVLKTEVDEDGRKTVTETDVERGKDDLIRNLVTKPRSEQ